MGFPLPDMMFGRNSVTLRFEGSPASPGNGDAEDLLRAADAEDRPGSPFTYHLTTMEALHAVTYDPERLATTKLSFADRWSQVYASRGVQSVLPPYDWTFATPYQGTASHPPRAANPADPRHHLRPELLERRDPILFYEHVLFYEDELADNGMSLFSARLRVMPTCFLVLVRYFLRVEGALVRIADTRLFHAFGSGVLVR